jgi:hypothetical protein
MRRGFEKMAASESGVGGRGNTKHKTNSFSATTATALQNATTKTNLMVSMLIPFPIKNFSLPDLARRSAAAQTPTGFRILAQGC